VNVELFSPNVHTVKYETCAQAVICDTEVIAISLQSFDCFVNNIVNVSVSISLYSALSQTTSNALGAPSTAETDAS